MTGKLKVADDLVVSMDYTLRLDDGEVIDSSEDGDALEFLQGRNQIISGLEKGLYGMGVGEEKDIVVAPAEGYGNVDDDAFQRVSKDIFPEDLELEPGMGLRMRDTDTGRPVVVYIADVGDQGVLLDFNHPLAGETLFFHVKVVDLRPATSEELAHGHVHGAGQDH